MSHFVDKLNLKEMAEEDIYFAKRDRELIEALHKKKLKKVVQCEKDDDKVLARHYEKRFEKITDKHKGKPRRLARACKVLIDEILDRCSARATEEERNQRRI